MRTTPILLAVCLISSFAVQAAEPLPEAARGIPIPKDKGYALQSLGDGLYFVTDGFYNTMFMTTGKGVIVVDAPPSLTPRLLQAIKEKTKEPIKHVIYSHAHADHIGAAGLYPADAAYIAHVETKARLSGIGAADRAAPYGIFVGGKPVPQPTVTFDRKHVLTVGDQVLELIYQGDDHEPGNIYVYAPKQKVLLHIDVIFPGWTPFKGLAISENVPEFVRAHDAVLAFGFEKMVAGHWGRVATRQDVQTQREYILDMQANAARALQTVNFGAVAQKTGMENIALLMETYLEEVSKTCSDLTQPRWKSRLGGVDIWTHSHCYQLAMSLRVN